MKSNNYYVNYYHVVLTSVAWMHFNYTQLQNEKGMTTTMIRQIDNFYLNKEEPNKSCLLALRSIIIDQDENITETQKWGMPCFCYKKKIFSYLWTDKKTGEPYILIVEGKYLDHPGLEAGKRSRMKIFRVNPNKDLPIKTIENILQQSLDLYRTGMEKPF